MNVGGLEIVVVAVMGMAVVVIMALTLAEQ